MTNYKGICRLKYPHWRGWNHIALYESITDDFDNDKELQKSVNLHYLEIKLYKIAFNLGIYAMFYGFTLILKG